MELLRPNNLKEFKGKKQIKENINIYIQSAIKNKTTFDHCLFYGLAGTGKTTLAFVIANELHQRIKVVQGGNIQKPTDIINLALTMQQNDVLFIDEIHAVNPQVVELLYSIIEDFAIDISLGKDFNSKLTRIKLPKFTLIGATTNLGKIPESLEERFGIQVYFGEYTNDEMNEIVKFYAEKYNVILNSKEIEFLANNCKGIPRIANKIVRRIKDFRTVNEKMEIKTILKRIGLVKDGINTVDLKYLKLLDEFNCPVGIKTLSHALLLDEEMIENKIEPYLIYCKYIVKTFKGRTLTEQGRKFLSNF